MDPQQTGPYGKNKNSKQGFLTSGSFLYRLPHEFSLIYYSYYLVMLILAKRGGEVVDII